MTDTKEYTLLSELLKSLQAENKKLRNALEFYADKKRYLSGDEFVAREALKGDK